MPKEKCKYWDKCYQQNEQHLKKYSHPEKSKNNNESKKRNEPLDLKDKPVSDPSITGVLKIQGDCDNDGQEVKRPENETKELFTEVLQNLSGKNYMQILQKRIKLSEQAEYDNLVCSNDFIRHKFLVEMPPDFYDFWKFVCVLKKDTQGEAALNHLQKTFQLQLVGPFEFLAGRFKNATIREPGDYLRHWRFFYDPPEFQTIFVRQNSGIHYGYWRDTPKDKERLLIARNDQKVNCVFEFVAGNAFDAFLYYLEKDFVSTPFTVAAVSNIKRLMKKYIAENEINIVGLDDLRKARLPKIVAKTFHHAGIVVPCDPKTKVGYRPLIVSDAELNKICDTFVKAGAENGDEHIKAVVLEKLQPIVTAASIAVDECDFGTALELGIDLFCKGRSELHMLVESLLVQAYSLLGRPQYIAIAKSHMEKRRNTLNLSIFDLDKET